MYSPNKPKPKSMIPQAKQDLKKSKDLFKKVQAVGKEMKNPGYNVDDRVNHFRLQHHMHNILVKKRSEIASKAIKKEEIELLEAGQDKRYHEFWADRTRRQIGVLKQKGKAIPSNLLSKLKKHQQALTQIKSGRVSQVAAESADVRTLNTASREIKTTTRISPDGRVLNVKKRMPRTEIEVGKKSAALESINKTNMMQDSINKMVKMDPLAPKTKIVLPPSQGLKSVGGDTQVHANMAEEMLNRLYESLSEKNKVKFIEKLDTEEGFDQLIKFAEEQGF
jgi:roadblock/LC7 domain-containing protein